MDKLKWCLKQKRGIKIIQQKPHLKDSYMKDAEESLRVCSTLKGKWKLITGYYVCYNALYSILMMCGIKSEIHECSIEMMKMFDFSEDDINFLNKLKDDRIQAQYYLKEITLKNENKVRDFVARCKEILAGLSSSKIEKIRKEIERYGC